MHVEPLCFIRTPFPEKFGVPRQSLLVEDAQGEMVFPKNDFYAEAFRGIEQFSHLWLIFEFHQVPVDSVQALVRPPRFEGKMKLGVFSTRSPHRPNRMGLSVVKFLKLDIKEDSIHLHVKGVDLVDGTPILDIKPYVPYADSIPEAQAHAFSTAPDRTQVVWKCDPPIDKKMIEEIVSLDPRPGHQKDDVSEYGVSINGFNVRFRKAEEHFEIFMIESLK